MEARVCPSSYFCKLQICALVALCIFAPLARADHVNAEWYSSGRALGMGNTGVANAEDPATAMFYNPAALARNKKFNLELFNPHVEMGTGNFKLSGQTTGLVKQSSLDKADAGLQKNPEVPSYYAWSLYPNFYGQNFAAGVLFRYEASAYRQRLTNDLSYRARFMVIPTFGLSIAMFNNLMKFGVAPRFIQLSENEHITSVYNNTGYFSGPAQGSAVGLDAGWLWTFPMWGLPTIGFVARNIGDTSFPAKAGIGIGDEPVSRHDSIKMTMDAGASFAPKINKHSLITFALDYRDLDDKTDTAMGRKINFGMETSIDHWFFFRVGARAGYWTTGIGFSGKSASLDIGTYADELDPNKFMEVPDRRVFIRYGGHF